MKKYIRVRIWGSFYNLYNSSLGIYYDQDLDLNYIKCRGERIEFEDKKHILKAHNNDFAPIQIEYNGDKNIKLYVGTSIKLGSIRCNLRNKNLSYGMNTIKYNKLRESKGNNFIFVQAKKTNSTPENITSESIRITLSAIEKKQDECKKSEKYKNDLIHTYSDKNIGSSINSDIRDYSRIKNLLIKNPNVTELCCGGSRTVFKIQDNSEFEFMSEKDGCILKLSKDKGKKYAVDANKLEVQTWQAVRGTDLEKYFCPITNIGPNHKYIVMKEAKVKKDNDDKNYDSIASEIKENIDNKTDIPDDLNIDDEEKSRSRLSYNYDIRPINVGIHNGNPVLIDYPFGAKVNIIEDDK